MATDHPVRRATDDRIWDTSSHAAAAREVYTDNRFGRTHPDPGSAARLGDNPVLHGPSDIYDHDEEHAQHREVRQLLGSYFSARRIQDIQPFITRSTNDLLDTLATRTTPVDLQREFSHPLPLMVLCELLGVPFDERAEFSETVYRMGDLTDSGRAADGHHDLLGYLTRVTRRLRQEPSAYGVLAGLCAAGFDNEQVAGVGSLLLFAGHDSTAFHLDVGILLLTAHPDQFRPLADDPRHAATAVEEILRLAEPDATGLPRYAREAVTLGTAHLEPGEALVPNIAVANLDERVFPDPFRFDAGRIPNPHLTFGHGAWHCLGAPLARAVLRAVLTGLARRFPGIRPAVPPAQLTHTDAGFAALPVTW